MKDLLIYLHIEIENSHYLADIENSIEDLMLLFPVVMINYQLVYYLNMKVYEVTLLYIFIGYH